VGGESVRGVLGGCRYAHTTGTRLLYTCPMWACGQINAVGAWPVKGIGACSARRLYVVKTPRPAQQTQANKSDCVSSSGPVLQRLTCGSRPNAAAAAAALLATDLSPLHRCSTTSPSLTSDRGGSLGGGKQGGGHRNMDVLESMNQLTLWEQMR
jgi:hypothetical protein